MRRSANEESARDLASESACDWMVYALAGWTLVCNAVVLLHGGLNAILAGAFVAVLATGGILLWRRRRTGAPERPTAARPAVEPAAELNPRRAAFALGLGVAVPALALVVEDVRIVWVAAVAVLCTSAVSAWRVQAQPLAPVASVARERVVWLVSALGALVPLFVHRRSLDDTYYVNVAVHALDAPSAPVLQVDTLHGVDGLAIMLPVYKVNSFELLSAAIAYLTGLDAIEAAHLVVPSVFGLFVALAYARLMRLLLPGSWLGALLAALAVLLLVGEGTEFWGNFSFVRLHQGKCVFLSVLVPLLVVYGVRFGRSQRLADGLLLAAAQIASIGLTSTAFWAAPAVAMMAVAAPLELRFASLRTLALGLAASSYVLVVGVALASVSAGAVSGYGEFPNAQALFQFSFGYMVGSGPVAFACFSAVLSAWAFVRDPLARRVCLLFPLGTLALLFNPFTGMWIAGHLTAFPTYYRVLWLIPVPALLAVILASPLELGRGRLPAPIASGAAAALTAAFLLFAPELYALSAENHVRVEPFALNVPPAELRAARAVVDHVPEGRHVLAPEAVGLWIVTLQRHPYPLAPRAHYLNIMREHFDPQERQLRLALTQYVAGLWRSANAPLLLAQSLQRFDLAGVMWASGVPWSAEIRRVLAGGGFRIAYEDGRYELWVR